MTLKQDKFYYVLLLQTLQKLLVHPEIRYEIEHPHNTDGRIMQDFCDGAAYKLHPLFSIDPHGLQIIAYFDELEVCNPIGSFAQIHKLGCLFFTLGNIRPQFRSTLKAIFLVAVAKSSDIAEHGIDEFLRPFVEDLKVLYCDGVTVETQHISYTYYGALLAVLADNLAAHAMAGFKESFSLALRICRTCMATSNQAQSLFLEASCTLRTSESHSEHCDLLHGLLHDHYSTTYGVNRRSVLEEVPGFSVINGSPHDIMHDLLEGAAMYELKLLIHHCVGRRYFTVNDLNDRLSRYDFESQCKPTSVDQSIGRNPEASMHQSAEQMMALVQHLPLIIGDKIPESDSAWQCFLLLCKICAIALTPACNQDIIGYLRVLIEEKLTLFREVYPTAKIIPKMHYFVHYPTQIERFGPLINSWTMRHEGKLSFIKRSSRHANFKNICLTVSSHHQRWLCYQLLQPHFLFPELEIGSHRDPCPFQDEPLAIQSQIQNFCHSVEPTTMILHPKWVKLHTTVYRNNISYVLITPADSMYPIFGKIVDICVVQGKPECILLTQHFKSKYYDSHFRAYVVSQTQQTSAISLHSLPDYHALCVRKNFVSSDNTLYISLSCAC